MANNFPKGPLAFPNAVPDTFYDFNDGMTLRDYFAAQAMNGLLGNPRYDGTPPPELAIWAYNLADVMLEERDG
jgi:hypothetical protein